MAKVESIPNRAHAFISLKNEVEESTMNEWSDVVLRFFAGFVSFFFSTLIENRTTRNTQYKHKDTPERGRVHLM